MLYAAAPIFVGLARAFPKVERSVSTSNPNTFLDKLEIEEADMIFCFGLSLYAGTGFHATTIFRELLVYVSSPKAPNLVWASDITCLKAGGKWYYLCIIMDLFSRKVVSWSLSAKANTGLVMETFRKAYKKHSAPYGLMFHSDQGSQYTSFSFRQLLDSINVVQSFSKRGCPFDNACCECFFKYLKKEETNRRTYPSFRELRLSIFEYIDYSPKKAEEL